VQISVPVQQVAVQQGIASLQAAWSAAQLWTVPQVPLVAPAGTLQTRPEQQSGSVVQLPALPTQVETHLPNSGSQVPEQHAPSAAQVSPFARQATHWPVALHCLLQQVVPEAQPVPSGSQLVVGTPQLQPDVPGMLWQEVGAQQAGSSAPAQVAPCALHVWTAVQCRTPVASGTQGAPAQHWSRNWQTLAVPTSSGSAAGMQQAGSLAS
jgi:hypothetical protein